MVIGSMGSKDLFLMWKTMDIPSFVAYYEQKSGLLVFQVTFLFFCFYPSYYWSVLCFPDQFQIYMKSVHQRIVLK